MKDNYSIRIIKDIHDPDLVSHWKRIEEETNCFPQMYYEWCEPWWRLQSGNRTLHIVTVEDEKRKIAGIAPLCIEKRFGLRFLRSFPIHFGDYYSVLVEENVHNDSILALIVAYINNFENWHILHLGNINSSSQIYCPLRDAEIAAIKLSDIYVADFEDLSFEDFLGKMSRNRRFKYRYALKQLQKKGQVLLECIEDAAGYMEYLTDMKYLYNKRWADDHTLPPDDVYYNCRNEAIMACFEKGKAALFILKLDEKTVAFRLGFINKGVFHEWKISHDPGFDSFSPGTIALGKVIEELTSRHFRQMDFMAGEYSYKQWWAPDGVNSVNYEFISCGRSIRAQLYLKYRLEWRDKLRDFYYHLLENRLVRAINRWMQAQRKQIQ